MDNARAEGVIGRDLFGLPISQSDWTRVAKFIAKMNRFGAAAPLAQDLDDLVQETFCRFCAAVRLGRLHTGRPHWPYLYEVAKHVIADDVRRRSRIRRLSNIADSALAPNAVEGFEPAEEDYEGEQRRRITGLIPRLEAQLHAIYVCRFVKGLSQREAARILALSHRQLRTWERRLLHKIRERLGGDSTSADQGAQHDRK
jgi:RNA polymerase sigma factor (sigma-70 family)